MNTAERHSLAGRGPPKLVPTHVIECALTAIGGLEHGDRIGQVAAERNAYSSRLGRDGKIRGAWSEIVHLDEIGSGCLERVDQTPRLLGAPELVGLFDDPALDAEIIPRERDEEPAAEPI